MLHRELLINGVFIGGVCDQGVGKDVIKSPWDGSVVGTVAEAGWAEANAAFETAQEAFVSWKSVSKPDRKALLLRIAELVAERRTELADLLVKEIGKPIVWAEGEVDRLRITFLAAADLLDQEPEVVALSHDSRAKDYECRFERFPIGPILAIIPYNWPYNLAAHKIAPALAAGNTVVMKVSSLAPLCGLTLARLIHEAGCPPGVFNAIHCATAISARLAKLEGWAMVSFTGSPKVGSELKETVKARRIALELGGNAFTVIHQDADPTDAIPRCVSGGYGYAGQICISVQHVLVHRSRLDEVRNMLIKGVEECPTGDPSLRETVCGPLISAEAADKVQEWCDEAVATGATQLAGGKRERNTLWPILIENVPMNTRLATEEVFGPVLTLEAYDTVKEAIDRINASQYGLQTGVFTKDEATIERFYQSLDVGTVVFNDVPTTRFDTMPYGGVKRSGIGREGVKFAFDEMTEIKTLLRRKN